MERLRLENVCFSYGKKNVLNNINYTFEDGKMYAVTGKSGAGKTTLLSVISGLTDATAGTVYCNGQDLKSVDKYEYRSRDVGVIFQSFNLLTKLTAVENVELSMDIADIKPENKRERAYELLEQVGLDRDEADRRVLKLSGGQQQRVAVARAISYDAQIIMADEPTGNLDNETQREIVDILEALAKDGKCVIVVTHSDYIAGRADEEMRLAEFNKKDAVVPAEVTAEGQVENQSGAEADAEEQVEESSGGEAEAEAMIENLAEGGDASIYDINAKSESESNAKSESESVEKDDSEILI